jgi:hypothetical protein
LPYFLWSELKPYLLIKPYTFLSVEVSYLIAIPLMILVEMFVVDLVPFIMILPEFQHMSSFNIHLYYLHVVTTTF